MKDLAFGRGFNRKAINFGGSVFNILDTFESLVAVFIEDKSRTWELTKLTVRDAYSKPFLSSESKSFLGHT